MWILLEFSCRTVGVERRFLTQNPKKNTFNSQCDFKCCSPFNTMELEWATHRMNLMFLQRRRHYSGSSNTELLCLPPRVGPESRQMLEPQVCGWVLSTTPDWLDATHRHYNPLLDSPRRLNLSPQAENVEVAQTLNSVQHDYEIMRHCYWVITQINIRMALDTNSAVKQATWWERKRGCTDGIGLSDVIVTG